MGIIVEPEQPRIEFAIYCILLCANDGFRYKIELLPDGSPKIVCERGIPLVLSISVTIPCDRIPGAFYGKGVTPHRLRCALRPGDVAPATITRTIKCAAEAEEFWRKIEQLPTGSIVVLPP